jgi:hypothetical protein
VDLAELYRLLFFQITSRLEHDEERVPVMLDPGPLVGLDGLLDR